MTATTATMPGLPLGALDGTVSTKGSQPETSRASGDAGASLQDTIDETVLAKLSKITTGPKLLEEATNLYKSATESDARNYLTHQLANTWKEVFDPKDDSSMPTELHNIGGYDAAKVPQSFKDTASILADTVRSNTSAIQRYEKLTGGAVSRRVSQILRETTQSILAPATSPRDRASTQPSTTTATTRKKSGQRGSKDTSEIAQTKAGSRERRTRAKSTMPGTAPTMGDSSEGTTDANDTKTAAAKVKAKAGDSVAVGTVPTKGSDESTVKSKSTKDPREARSREYMRQYAAGNKAEETAKTAQTVSPKTTDVGSTVATTAVDRKPKKSSRKAGTESSPASRDTAASSKATPSAAVTQPQPVQGKRRKQRKRTQSAKGAPSTTASTAAKPATKKAETTSSPDTTEAASSNPLKAVLGTDKRRTPEEWAADSNFQSAVNTLGEGMTEAAKQHMGSEAFSKVPDVDQEAFRELAKTLGGRAKKILEERIKTEIWIPTQDGFIRRHGLQTSKGEGTLTQTAGADGGKTSTFAWKTNMHDGRDVGLNFDSPIANANTSRRGTIDQTSAATRTGTAPRPAAAAPASRGPLSTLQTLSTRGNPSLSPGTSTTMQTGSTFGRSGAAATSGVDGIRSTLSAVKTGSMT